MKFMGQFLIVDRPSPTTITVKVGITKGGLPRLETHHWSRAHVAHLRPDAVLAERTDLGRRPRVASDHRDRQQQIAPKTTKPPFATYDTEITQPRFRRGQTESSPTPAGVGGEENLPGFESLNSLPLSPTGPPPVSPFSTNFSRQQKQTFTAQPETSKQTTQPDISTLLRPGTSSSGLEPGREPLPLEANGGVAPPETKGAPPASSAGTPSHLHDHDYFRRPSATLDHDYSRQPPNVGPPPGFENYYPEGRPRRQTNMPAKYRDYDLN